MPTFRCCVCWTTNRRLVNALGQRVEVVLLGGARHRGILDAVTLRTAIQTLEHLHQPASLEVRLPSEARLVIDAVEVYLIEALPDEPEPPRPAMRDLSGAT